MRFSPVQWSFFPACGASPVPGSIRPVSSFSFRKRAKALLPGKCFVNSASIAAFVFFPSLISAS